MSTSSAPIRPRGLRPGRAAAYAGATVLVLLATIWILPGMLDWNRFRGSIASLVAAGIGRPVQIDGNITLHLLPQPVLTATDLKLDDAGDGVTMRVGAVRLRVALGPLMAGRIDARELTLQSADLRLPWPPPSGALARRPPAWISAIQARFEESRLQVGDFVLTGIDGSLAVDPDSGLLSAAGAATLFDRPVRFTVRLGRPGRDGAAPLDISLDGQDKLRDTGGTVSGTVDADGSLAGHLTARGADLSQLLPAPAAPWRADGRISASGGVLVADELAFEIGGSPARGAVALRVQPKLRLDVALLAGRLDLDAWTPVLLRATRPGHGTSVPTGLDLSAESATLAGGTLRQVRTALDLDADGVTVREATAMLPGDAKFALHGRFPEQARAAGFDGAFTLIAPDLQTTLHWLEPVAPAIVRALPPGSLRTADIAAKLTADASQISLTDVSGRLDGGTIGGGLAIRRAARPAISFGLTLDRLLLDPFLPNPGILSDPASAYAAAVKSLANAGFDSDLKLQVQQADWRGAHFGPLAFDVQSEAGHLTVRRFEATLAGIHAAISGSLGDGGRIAEGRMELTSPEIAPLRPFVPADVATLGHLVGGPATLLVTASGPQDALALRANLELGDLRVEAQPVLNIPAHRWAGSLTLQHPGAPRLLARIGYPDTVRWLGDGSLSVIAQASKSPGRLDLSSVDLVAGQLRASGQMSVTQHKVTGRLKAETLTLPGLDPRSPDPLPFAMLRLTNANLHVDADQVTLGLNSVATGLSAEVVVQDGGLLVDKISAKHDDAVLAGSVRVEEGDLPHVTGQGRIDGVAIGSPVLGAPLDLVGGTLTAEASLDAKGFSPAALMATLDGTGRIGVQPATVTGFDLPAAAAFLAHPEGASLAATLRPIMLNGASTLASLDVPFQVHGGVALVHAVGQAPPSTVRLDGSVDLLGRTIEGRLILSPGPGEPDLPVRLSGPVSNPVRTPELAGAARWLAERP